MTARNMKFTWTPPFFVTTGKFSISQANLGLNDSNDFFITDENANASYRSLDDNEIFNQTTKGSEANEKSPTPSGGSTNLKKKEISEPKQNSFKIEFLSSQIPNGGSSGAVLPPGQTTEEVKKPLPESNFLWKQKRFGVSAGSLDQPASLKNKRLNFFRGDKTNEAQSQSGGNLNVPKCEKSEETEELIRNAIMNNEFFKVGLEDKEVMQAVVDAMYMQKMPEDSYVIREGEIGTHLYVCEEGFIDVYKEGKKVNTLGPGKIFGELALLYNTRRNATIKATTPCTLWVLDRDAFNRIARSVEIRRIEECVKHLSSVPLLGKLDSVVLRKMTDLLKTSVFNAGTPIIKQGEEGNLFYIITDGNVLVTVKHDDGSEKNIGKLGKGDFFGEGALIAKDKRTATVTAQTTVECLTLDREPFIQYLGGLKEVQEILKSRKAKLKNVKEQTSEYSYIRLEDLEVKGTLGIGGFGRVELVEYRKNRKLTFALKKLKKHHVVEFQQQLHVLNEKATMMCCHSQFIAKLHNTYKDAKYLYFLMEACLGGDVWSLLQKRKFFDETTARFITACVVEAFHYLHDRGIVYRDLKPENLLFDSKGYVKLVDFGFAKKLIPAEKTWTFAGTPEYLAPEIVRNKGHDRAVDYWALGILIYELLVGKPPFRGSDHMTTYNLILKGITSVSFPKFLTKSAELLIKKLCKLEATERLGYQKEGVEGIKCHKWFSDFNWATLRKSEMKAPFMPRIQSPTDLSNFEECPKDKEIPPDGFGDWDLMF